jgi:hypothetical protein
LNLTVINPNVDFQFGFMTLDWDAKIRLDCSSPFAMASLIADRDRFDISTGNDADADRHGDAHANSDGNSDGNSHCHRNRHQRRPRLGMVLRQTLDWRHLPAVWTLQPRRMRQHR